MGLDMRPIGSVHPKYKKRFDEIFDIIIHNKEQKPSLLDRVFKKPLKTREELLSEFRALEISPYETVEAPRYPRDEEAVEFLKSEYKNSDKSVSEEAFLQKLEGIYLPHLAKRKEGFPVYNNHGAGGTGGPIAFRGSFLSSCSDIMPRSLIEKAWTSQKAENTLVYGRELMDVALDIAKQNNLSHLQEQRDAPDSPEDSLESKLHIVFSLANWLIFFGSHGHGYEADF